ALAGKGEWVWAPSGEEARLGHRALERVLRAQRRDARPRDDHLAEGDALAQRAGRAEEAALGDVAVPAVGNAEEHRDRPARGGPRELRRLGAGELAVPARACAEGCRETPCQAKDLPPRRPASRLDGASTR